MSLLLVAAAASGAFDLSVTLRHGHSMTPVVDRSKFATA